MKRILLILFGLMVVLVGQRPFEPPAAQAQGSRLVLAHYYAWYDPNSFGAGKTPFTNPNPYFSTDAGTIQRHVSEAQGLGLDGFVQAWYGPNPNQQTEPNFSTLLNVAGGSGFKAAVSFEPISAFMGNNDDRANALATLLATHAQHPAYLRIDGKPVIYFWANWALSVGDWEYIRNIADPGRNSIWMAEGGNMSYLSVFDGMYLYNIAWSPNPAGINARWAGETRAATNTYGTKKYWSATAMPGFNDSLLGRGANTIVRDRGDGSYYRNSFSGAAATDPDMLVITSFNEWAEGSHIEPANEFGGFYYDLTREMVGTYKAGGVPDGGGPVVDPPPPPPEDSPEDPPADQGGNVGQQVGTPAPTATFFPTSTPQATPTAGADGRIVYIVQPGDTLISIAIQFDKTLDELYANNGLNSASLLSVGQEIVIAYDLVVVAETATAEAQQTPDPTATPNYLEAYPNTIVRESDGAIIYTVQPGNTLIEIALLYDLTMDEIYELNNLNENSLLSVDQPIIVGYVEQSEVVQGGSADLPADPPTATPTVAPSATPTLTPIPPTETPEPTAVSALPSPAAPTATPAPAQASAGLFSSNTFLIALVGVVLIIGALGGMLLYLGRRL